MPLGNETSQTLDRGIRLLEIVAASGGTGRSVTDLARELNVGRPVVYRLLATLAEHDLVRRFDDGQVRLGLALVRLAAATHPALQQVAVPVLRELADAAGATAHLTIVDGGEALAVAVVEPSWTDVHVGYRVGRRHPLDKGAAGRAILAARHGQVEVVATTGELEQGAHGVAAAVMGVPGLEASVGVVAFGPLDADVVGTLVATASRRLSDDLRD